ncbi:MAG: DegT/DnrJ/EryC1/StrS family aminotransferase [Gemmatimonadetes bacterium]|nr:DegT/DnrJ/EryC1/StrS family aminotransferase [Gemmatimonadota bacterium]
MKVPLLDLAAHHASLRVELLDAVRRVMGDERYILGPEVEALEREIAARCEVRHGVGVSSGSDALIVALMALGIGPGDEVVTTTYTFFATAGAIHRLGATPVFVDIDPESFNLDQAATVAAIGSRTKAIVPVHLFGRCASLDEILLAASARGVPVIEDAAQAIGAATPDGRAVGSFGVATCFSFYPSKSLGALGDGGMVVSDDDRFADQVRLLRGHGARPEYVHEVVGGNFRLDALQAALLRVKLAHLDRSLAGRAKAAARYRALFAERANDVPIALPGDVRGHTYSLFVIRADRRDELREHLGRCSIGSAVYYPIPLHLQACFQELGYGEGDLPIAERAARETLALPLYPEITEEQQRAVVDACLAFYS